MHPQHYKHTYNTKSLLNSRSIKDSTATSPIATSTTTLSQPPTTMFSLFISQLSMLKINTFQILFPSLNQSNNILTSSKNSKLPTKPHHLTLPSIYPQNHQQRHK